MFNPQKDDIDLESSVEIAEGVYWIGFYDEQAGLHCTPYMIVDCHGYDENIANRHYSRPDHGPALPAL
jgi:hypothetical protein